MDRYTLCIRILIVALCLTQNAVWAQADSHAERWEVQLSVANFGMGGISREGDWNGIQVQVLDQGSSSRDIILRLTIRDEDGDDAQYDRFVTSNPGSAQSYWLYGWIPFQSSNIDFVISAYEAIDSGNDRVGEYGFRAGKQIGQIQVYNPQVQAPGIRLAGIIGSNQLGLNIYGMSQNGREVAPLAHELLRNSAGLTVDLLPDRWQGLMPFEVLVWSSSQLSNTNPSRLSPEKARAVQTWVERGGHLVIVMPSSGDTWFSRTHPLSDILPQVQIDRIEGVELESVRPLLTETMRKQLPENTILHAFKIQDSAELNEAIPVMSLADGKHVVIRRLVGSGMVTVVGLPLQHGELRKFQLPETAPFWHRILGMRGMYIHPDQMTEDQKSDSNSRRKLLFDDGVSDEIAKTGRAVQGILFGVIVFVLYWLIAGPAGYALLKAKSKKHHAWVFFVLTIGSFTLIAWVGATFLRPKRVDIQHLTLFEQVHGSNTQRARSWMSVMLPSYGQSTISMDDPDSNVAFQVEQSTQLISPWTSPDMGGTFTDGFPDNTGYRIESRQPSALRVPTRATSKSLLSEWAGSGEWGMPYPVGEPGDLGDPSLKLSGTVVEGKIIHSLPLPLEDIKVFVVSRMTPILQPGQELGNRMISRVSVIAPTLGADGWEPNEVLDLEEITRLSSGNQTTSRMSYFSNALRYGVDGSALSQTAGDITDRLIAGRLISQLDPPRFTNNTTDILGSAAAIRRMLHGWDLGKWFTQPCLIITGVIDIASDDEVKNGMPYPIWVNDQVAPSSGKTIVTWIYPFESNPPDFSMIEPVSTQNTDPVE